MKTALVKHPVNPAWISWLWLGIATVLAIFSNGRWLIPIATWIAPVFFLRYVHSQKPFPGLVLGGFVMAMVYGIAWQGLIPLDSPLYYLVTFWLGILFWIPYCIERLLSPRIHGFASTWVFPLAYTSIEFIYALTNPFLSNGSLAYTQSDSLPLLQIVSVTGIWGIIFLVTWTSSVIHWAWGCGFAWSSIRRGVGIWAGVFAVVFLFGEVRLALGQPQSETVRVASVAATQENIENIKVAEEDPNTADEHYQVVLADYLSRTRQQAIAGAKIVIWDELAVRTTFDQEAAAIQQGRNLASEEQIYLLMALRVQDINTSTDAIRRPRENKVVLIGPDGQVIWEYLKSATSPGDEEIRGDGMLPTSDTPLGKLAASICFDMDDPTLIRQAGSAHVGLMLTPAWNHPEDEAMQLHMASFRAVENGFSLLRSTREGFSAAYDNHGRLLALTGRTTVDGTLLANVPIESQWTLYATIGDLFGWLCTVGLVSISILAVIHRRSQGRPVSTSALTPPEVA
jgi:apolipoprotein N-acyltransferase